MNWYYAIAGQQMGSAAGAHGQELYAARDAAALRDGDRVHTREQAWFALDVQHEPARALSLATQNWQQQREPADVRILWRAARAAGSVAAETSLRQWLEATHYEDATLTAAVRR